MNYLKLELGTVYTVALKYPKPQPSSGFHGSELRWMLMDGRALYAPVSLEAQFRAFKPGERFTVQKVKAGRSVKWSIQRANAVEAQPANELPEERQKQQPAITLLERSDSVDATSYEIPSSRLDDALKTAVSAAAAAEKHGAAIGYSIRFRPEDVRAMAISVLIGMQRAA